VSEKKRSREREREREEERKVEKRSIGQPFLQIFLNCRRADERQAR